MRKVESCQQGPPAKNAKLDVVLAVHCRADLVTECMKKKKTLLSGDFRFRFLAENECLFSFRFRTKMEFHLHRYFRLWPKIKNAFRSASSIYITKRSWSWS